MYDFFFGTDISLPRLVYCRGTTITAAGYHKRCHQLFTVLVPELYNFNIYSDRLIFSTECPTFAGELFIDFRPNVNIIGLSLVDYKN